MHCVPINKKPSWTLGMADRTAPVVKLTRQFYRKRSTTTEMKLSKKSSILFTSWILVDKRSSYLRELVWQPSWQLDNCPDWLNCASVYKLWTLNCALLAPSGQCPRQATPTHSSQIVNNISDVGYVMQTNNPESGFNSDHTIRQYAHGLLLESQFLPSSTDCLAVRA